MHGGMDMIRASVLLAALLAGSTPTNALSGAEFLAAERSFASGYAWGALDYRLSVGSEADSALIRAAGDCFRKAGVDSSMFYEAVRAYLDNNLSALTQPAIGAVLRTSLEMCPWEN